MLGKLPEKKFSFLICILTHCKHRQNWIFHQTALYHMVLHLEYFDNVLPAILTMVELVDVSLQIFQDEMTLLSAHDNNVLSL